MVKSCWLNFRQIQGRFGWSFLWKKVGQALRPVVASKVLLALSRWLTIVIGQRSPFVDIGWARNISVNPLSAKCRELAHAWLRDCLPGHCYGSSECVAYKETRLPTRVLYVGSDHREPFLYETKGENGKYVALSYRWGESLPLTTTIETLKERKQGIAISSLPNTLRDAVLVARAFGISYLWVDALCIVQDLSTDWSRESSKMGDIFRKAFFVIRADAAVDCCSGFLHLRTGHLARETLEIKFPGAGRPQKSVFVRDQVGRILGEVAHASDKTPTALSTRGWVLQERYLASRTLIFAAEEMAWECRSITRCECNLAVCETYDLLVDWKLAVETYSSLQLTKGSDRLPGFSGIAATFQDRSPTSEKYFCGIWGNSLAEQLLWYVPKSYGPKYISQRHGEYHAPSWSWASITGPVTYYHRELDKGSRAYDFKIVAAECQLASPNPYGSVRSANLKVSGCLCPVQIGTSSSGDDFSLLFLPDLDSAKLVPIRQDLFDQDCKDLDSNVGWEITVNVAGKPRRAWFIPGRGFLPDVVGKGLEIFFQDLHFFLMILKTDREFAGLILRKSGTQAMGRVGFCSISALGMADLDGYSQGKIKSFDKLLALFESLPKSEVIVI